MQIDSFTVLLFALFIKAVLGGLFLVFWYRQPNAPWYAWWGATFCLACIANILFGLRGFTSDLLGIGLGNVALIAEFACNWQAARVFDHKPALWWPLIAAPGLWFAACLIPTFIETVAYRVVFSSLIVSTLIILSAAEFWRSRDEPLPSRWPVIVLYSTFALFLHCGFRSLGYCRFRSVRCRCRPARSERSISSWYSTRF